MESVIIRKRLFESHEHEGYKCIGPSDTLQEFKDDADINNIIARYHDTGLLTDPLHPGTAMPEYGDFSAMPDYKQAMNAVVSARNAFDALPSAIRERFNYDPQKLIEFCEKEENRDEAIKLGLVVAPVGPASDTVPVVSGKSVGQSEPVKTSVTE